MRSWNKSGVNNGIWKDRLKGKVFVSTRPAGRSEKLKELIAAQGGTVLEMPMIAIRKTQLSADQKEAFIHLDRFDWIVFTSSNSVQHFFARLGEQTGGFLLPAQIRVAVIGKPTASALEAYGCSADYISKDGTGEGFAEELREAFSGKGYHVLFPAGNLARGIIADSLQETAGVTRVNVYQTLIPRDIDRDVLKRVIEGRYDMIVFTSKSGVDNFCRVVDGKVDLLTLRIACIGRTTAGAVMQSGIQPLVVATKMDSEGIAEAIMDYYR